LGCVRQQVVLVAEELGANITVLAEGVSLARHREELVVPHRWGLDPLVLLMRSRKVPPVGAEYLPLEDERLWHAQVEWQLIKYTSPEMMRDGTNWGSP
jgi:hypothetical protein